MMRISGGEAKGRILNFPSRSIQRPTSNFLRETLFNILESPVNQNFLDIFAGSGAVGLEALSRGAKTADFVEKSKELVAMIKENVILCGYQDKCRIIHADYQSALRDMFRKQQKYDVIFADPPYHQGLIGKTLQLLKEYPVLHENGLIVLQHSTREKLADAVSGWNLKNQRKYGDNLLTFIRMDSR